MGAIVSLRRFGVGRAAFSRYTNGILGFEAWLIERQYTTLGI